MTRFYCPRCGKDFVEHCKLCPYCGQQMQRLWDAGDHVGKLDPASHHPKLITPLRAAWLLGKTSDPRTVRALIDLFSQTDDVTIARGFASLLRESDTPEALLILEILSAHPA